MPTPRFSFHRSARARTSAPIAVAVLVALTLAGCAGGAGASTDDAEAEGRTVTTLIGEVTVPEQIDSVVVLEGRRDLDIVLSLGLPLAGYPYEGPDSGLDLEAPLAAATAAAQADGAVEAFLADEVNLEAIAELAPTVIIGRINDVEPILAELQAIAPVVPVSEHSDGVTWQEDLTLIGEATGTEDTAAELIAAYDARVEEIATTYADQIANTIVSPISYNAEGSAVQATRLQSLALIDVGAVPSQAFADAIELQEDAVDFSPEQRLDAHKDAEAILALINSADDYAATATDSLWQQLPAVQAGNVIRMDKMSHEGGPTTAMHVLDVIEQLYSKI